MHACSRSSRALSSPKRVALLAAVTCLWLLHILLIYNHQIAVQRLPDDPPLVAPDGVVYQTRSYSCGPACLATLFRHYSMMRSEQEWAELAGTGVALGTHLAGLRRAGEQLGFEPVILNPTYEQLNLIRHPAVLFETRLYHLVTFWGMDREGKAIVRDPALGRDTWGPEEFHFYTPFHPIMLLYYPGRVPRCDSQSSPNEIARVQRMLARVGYYRRAVDGKWRDSLGNAIRDFQATMNVPQTGVVDAPTSVYLEGVWHLVVDGPPGPFMMLDRPDAPDQTITPMLRQSGSDRK